MVTLMPSRESTPEAESPFQHRPFPFGGKILKVHVELK